MAEGNKLPYLPFYLTDWETDSKVRMMGPATRYHYLALLIHQWREGSIPSDPDQIKRLLTVPADPQDIDSMVAQILACFRPVGNGRLSNAKMERVRKYHLAIIEGRRRGAEAANRVIAQRTLSERSAIRKRDAALTLSERNQNQNQNQKEQVLLPSNGKKPRSTLEGGLERSSDQWLDWADKHPNQAQAGGYPLKAIREEIERRKAST